ncbi:NUDIX domain-containing protein [Pelagibacterium sp.]|uniref:NUDIX domain-containing protein n=1 Tax=Pelagibacterium sp. TaxID=1967288 RepID=UPI003BAD13B2
MARGWKRHAFGALLRLRGIYKHLTLGARAAVIVEGKVLLVRHGYVAGWQMPGGGVDPGETAEQAARREVLEETGYEIEGEMRLFSLYHATGYTDRDHVALYVGHAAQQVRPFVPGREIVEIGWFALGALPGPIAPSAERRLAEIGEGRTPSPNW